MGEKSKLISLNTNNEDFKNELVIVEFDNKEHLTLMCDELQPAEGL